MFAFFNRSRRHVAVLTALAMVASVLVAAPAVAADDPEPSLEATFTACVGIESSGFTDVPAAHPNAGDIDCIAYYGITMGTGDGNYSPSMAVTREHMALFLTRLAARVGIEMVSDPGDTGFTDIGDLSANSQTAIAQIADLEITMGTGDGTTYSPADHVERGHMALFLSRLMNLMTPYGGADSEDAHTPSDVDDEDSDDIGSPYTDTRSVTVRTSDAITALYELGVASGISATAYAPTASITRAAMAEFMTGVMDHSNLRPAGLSIQTSDASSFGDNTGSVVVSVRDDSFAVVADQVVDIFSSDAGAFDDDGACKTITASCEWNDGEGEELTDESGNIVDDGGADRGKTNVFYAWIGSEDKEEFDIDETDHVSVSVESKNEEQDMKVTTSLSKNADKFTADLDKGGSVTITVQLVDSTDDDAKDVARSGIEIEVGVMRVTDPQSDGDGLDVDNSNNRVVYNNTSVTTLTTDDDGTVTFVVDAPEDDNDTNDVQFKAAVTADTTVDPEIEQAEAVQPANLENRDDTITFTYKAVKGRSGSAALAPITIQWKEDNPVTTSAKSSAPAYVVRDKDGDVAITTSVTLYDQYGNGIREGGNGQKVAIRIDDDTGDTFGDDGVDNVSVNRNGTATRRKVIEQDVDNANALGTPFTVRYDEKPAIDSDDQTTGFQTGTQDDVTAIMGEDNMAKDQMVQVVTEADDDDVGSVVVNSIDTDDAEFLANTTDTPTSGASDLVYSYDSDDTFVNSIDMDKNEGELLTMEKFEDMLDDYDGEETNSERAMVDVVVYDPDGSSIFRVTNASGVPSS